MKLDNKCYKCVFVTNDSNALKKRNSTLEICIINVLSVIFVTENSKALEKCNCTLERSITHKSENRVTIVKPDYKCQKCDFCDKGEGLKNEIAQ